MIFTGYPFLVRPFFDLIAGENVGCVLRFLETSVKIIDSERLALFMPRNKIQNVIYLMLPTCLISTFSERMKTEIHLIARSRFENSC